MLTSPLNTSGQSAIAVDQGNGLQRRVVISYPQRRIQTDVLSAVPAGCDTSDEFALQCTDFEIGLESWIPWKIDEEYASKICEGQGWATEQMIAGMFNAVSEDINANCITAMNASFGINKAYGDAAQHTHDVYDAANGAVKNGVWLTFLDEVMNANQFAAAPLIVMGSTMWQVAKLQNAGCCNEYGVDMAALYSTGQYGFFHDQMIDAALGSVGEGFVVEPGAAQFVPWYKYRNLGKVLNAKGAYAAWEEASGAQRGIIKDPSPGGLTYNFRVLPDTCEENFVFWIGLHYDVFVLPSDMYQAGDTLAGSNGLLNYKFT